jgi:hypothetical protein
MAVSVSTGLFGIATLQLTLQDGWMLTGDNSKLGDVTIAAIQALSSATTGGASKAGLAAAGQAQKAAAAV